MSDIVTRLWGNTGKYPGFENLNTEAAAEIARLRAELAGRDSELLRVRTTAHGAAHALDNIAVEHGLGPGASPLTVQEFVRKLKAELAAWKAEAEAGRELDIISHESPRDDAWGERHHAARLKLEAKKAATNAIVKKPTP